jgi:hypothetical protein
MNNPLLATMIAAAAWAIAMLLSTAVAVYRQTPLRQTQRPSEHSFASMRCGTLLQVCICAIDTRPQGVSTQMML